MAGKHLVFIAYALVFHLFTTGALSAEETATEGKLYQKIHARDGTVMEVRKSVEPPDEKLLSMAENLPPNITMAIDFSASVYVLRPGDKTSSTENNRRLLFRIYAESEEDFLNGKDILGIARLGPGFQILDFLVKNDDLDTRKDEVFLLSIESGLLMLHHCWLGENGAANRKVHEIHRSKGKSNITDAALVEMPGGKSAVVVSFPDGIRTLGYFSLDGIFEAEAPASHE